MAGPAGGDPGAGGMRIAARPHTARWRSCHGHWPRAVADAHCRSSLGMYYVWYIVVASWHPTGNDDTSPHPVALGQLQFSLYRYGSTGYLWNQLMLEVGRFAKQVPRLSTSTGQIPVLDKRLEVQIQDNTGSLWTKQASKQIMLGTRERGCRAFIAS